MRGNSDGPYFWPGKSGKVSVSAIIASENTMSARPERMSLARTDDFAERDRKGVVSGGLCPTSPDGRWCDQVLARPAAFIASPIFLSLSSMNAAKRSASPQITPKPRDDMKSLYSFES